MEHSWFTVEVTNRPIMFVEYCTCGRCNTQKLIVSLANEKLMVLYKKDSEHVWDLLQDSVIGCPWRCRE